MLICHCNAVSDRTIREAVRAGACSTAAVRAACGAATGCGGCQDLVERIVEEEQSAHVVQLRRRVPCTATAELG